jgi:antitoxin (DNA-binding transcriptional repressor) of toxin-antitoxin stability system
MQRVTITKLKNRLGAYFRKVRAGETVVVLVPHRRPGQAGRSSGTRDPGPTAPRHERPRLKAGVTIELYNGR